MVGEGLSEELTVEWKPAFEEEQARGNFEEMPSYRTCSKILRSIKS